MSIANVIFLFNSLCILNECFRHMIKFIQKLQAHERPLYSRHEYFYSKSPSFLNRNMFNLNENIHVMNKSFHIVNSEMRTDKAFRLH